MKDQWLTYNFVQKKIAAALSLRYATAIIII